MMTESINPYAKGSVWRRWDLHIHTPDSIVQDYGGNTEEIWNKYIEEIAKLPSDISALAITDYLFINGYKKIIARKHEIPNIKLIIPNIEFRLDSFSGSGSHPKRLNFHVLFDPIVSSEIIQEQLLNCLSKAYLIEDGKEWHQTPTVRSLEDLGKRIKASAPTDNSIQEKSDLMVGFSNITYKKEDILKLLEKDCFKGKFITAIGYSEWSQFRWDQSAAEKRTLINEANFCLTNQEDVEKINEQGDELKGLKLKNIIFHSSDAHSFVSLGKTKLWLKADPTFAGLKQVLNESQARVFIGDKPPNYKHSHQIISKICIQTSNNWFTEYFNLDLNRDLVTVIGGRGSGKSGLVEMIAYGAGSYDDSGRSFIDKASDHKETISNVQISLIWEDNTETGNTIGELYGDQKLVRYLPQKAVEKLCDPDHNDELQEQIENVIFQSLDETAKSGASDFSELKREILKSSTEEKNQIEVTIREINRNLAVLRNLQAGLPNKKQKLDNDLKQLKKLKETLPILPKADIKDQEILTKLYQLKSQFEEKIILLKSHLRMIEEIKTKIRLFDVQINSHVADITKLATIIGISDLNIFKIELKNEEIIRTLNLRVKELNDLAGNLKSGAKSTNSKIIGISEGEMLAGNLDEIQVLVDAKVKTTKAYETEKIKYQKQQAEILSLEKQIEATDGEIKKIEHDIIPKIPVVKEERWVSYLEYFSLLQKEKAEIEKLYQPLQQTLMEGTETDKRLKFEAKITYLIDQHLEQGLEIIDRTRKGNFRDVQILKEALKDLWSQFTRSNYGKVEVQNALSNLFSRFTHENGEVAYKIQDQLKGNYQRVDFDNWFFGLSNFEIASSISFDATDLHLLSPGQKGIVLLMLYLKIDKNDTRPLLIDQPEDNLDSLSVYNDLIEFFRDRKQFRQIIMVTHNPNLVVNTDTEQVVVANYVGGRTPRLQYLTGSLEDNVKEDSSLDVESLENGIIEHVCNILEGGDQAFDKRKLKYQISAKNFKYTATY